MLRLTKPATIILLCLIAVDVVSPMPQSPTFDPGNTFNNCVRPLACASCKGFETRSGFRTIDGTCNNLRFPTAGAANTALRRLVRAEYTDGVDTPRGFPGTPPIPTANQVSEELFKVEEQNKGTGDLAVMFMTMGQFLDHDMSVSPHANCDVNDCSSIDTFKYPCFPLLFENGGSECTGTGRAFPVCQNNVRKIFRQPRNQFNTLTAFIDGSQIYGSSFRQHQRVRTQDGTGELKVTSDNLMAFDDERTPCRVLGGCSLVGDGRGDENIPLHAMHTIWVREHNRVAKELRRINPSWDGELVYQTARKIVGGILQHIIYTEWLPSIVRLPRYRGYNSRLNPAIANVFSTAAFRFGHSLIPNKFSQLNSNFDDLHEAVTLQASFRNREIINERGIEPTMLGLAGNRSNNVDNGFAFGIVRKLFIRPGQPGRMDLTALNIQRGRDHGIPTYGAWRRACRLPTVTSFEELEPFFLSGTIEAFQSVYSSPDEIDLFAAGISEKHIPGLQVGPTFECIFRYQFSRLRDADRFFYQSYGVFTTSEFNEIKKASMARVMCDNLNGIVSVQPNAFKVDSASGNDRISCTDISSLDLSPWKENS